MAISSRRITQILLAATGIILVLSLAVTLSEPYQAGERLLPLIREFNVDSEQNIPTWFASFVLLVSAALLTVIGLSARQHGRPYAGRWLGLAGLFLLLSIDETATLHEDLVLEIQARVGTLGLLALISGLLAAGAMLHRDWLRDLPRRTLRSFLLAGGIYVFAAVIIELIGKRFSASFPSANVAYVLIITVEEALEFLAIIYFVHALVSHAARAGNELRLRFTES